MTSVRSRWHATSAPAARAAVVVSIVSVTFLSSSSGHSRASSSDRMGGSGESADLRQAAQRLEMCSAKNVAGVGLRGEYFASQRDQRSALLVRVDPTIDFSPDLDWPASNVSARPRFARWSGWIKPPMSGRYRFHFPVPGGRVSVSQQALVGQNVAADASIELAAGRFYPVQVELDLEVAVRPEGLIQLEWTAPHGARYLIPRSLLYLPSETAAGLRS